MPCDIRMSCFGNFTQCFELVLEVVDPLSTEFLEYLESEQLLSVLYIALSVLVPHSLKKSGETNDRE